MQSGKEMQFFSKSYFIYPTMTKGGGVPSICTDSDTYQEFHINTFSQTSTNLSF